MSESQVEKSDEWHPLSMVKSHSGSGGGIRRIFCYALRQAVFAMNYLPRRKVRWLAIWLHSLRIVPCVLIVFVLR